MKAQGCSSYFNSRHPSRRDFIRVGSLSGMGLCLGDILRAEGQAFIKPRNIKAKSVIQIVCGGGISAQESWNPKPEAPLEYRGPFGVSKTKMAGIVLSETMPRVAKIADKMTIIRSLTGKDADHGRAIYSMLTGHRMSPALVHPSIASVVNQHYGSRNNLPGYMAIPDLSLEGSGTGYLSPKYGAFSVGGDPASDQGFEVRDLRLPKGIDNALFSRRRDLRSIVNDEFAKLESDPAPLETMDAFYQQAYTMISSQEVRDAFDLSQESDATKKAYGHNQFRERGTYGKSYGSMAGMRMLLARRLVEAGARFVSLTYGGWDTHVQIREDYQMRMPAFDHALAALINDLDQRGILDNTLVWVTSEFGRSPKINASAGRDHFPRVFATGLAGGGLKQGYVHGNSDTTSTEIAADGLSLPDFHASLYHLMGIDSNERLMAPGGRPVAIVDGGKVETKLFA
ncbi:DUF1501 domain-containing protein [Verrucomicrobiaceae bacterium 227]